MHRAVEADDLERQLLQLTEGLRMVACRALGAAEAEDAVQETLARALLAIREQRVPEYAPFPAFVYGICKHVLADLRRRGVRERGAALPENVVAPMVHPLDGLVRAEEVAAVSRAVAQLPRDERELLRRCFVQGERVVDIAASAGEPPDRVRKRKSRALQRVRDLLRRSASPPGHGAGIPTISEA